MCLTTQYHITFYQTFSLREDFGQKPPLYHINPAYEISRCNQIFPGDPVPLIRCHDVVEGGPEGEDIDIRCVSPLDSTSMILVVKMWLLIVLCCKYPLLP